MTKFEILILLSVGVPLFVMLLGVSIAVVIQVWRDLTGD